MCLTLSSVPSVWKACAECARREGAVHPSVLGPGTISVPWFGSPLLKSLTLSLPTDRDVFGASPREEKWWVEDTL